MATTLKIQSFVESNIRERGELAAAAPAGATSLSVRSTEGFLPGHTICVGALSREGCERVVIASATDPTVLTLLTPNHSQFEPVTSVVGDLIHIYRAANIDGSVPADDFFTVLATRNIDPDQLSSFYTDAGGSSAFWYRSTYYNATTNDETALSNSEPVRDDDFGHYATIAAIRSEAGFGQAHNLSDLDVDQQRRAESPKFSTPVGASRRSSRLAVASRSHGTAEHGRDRGKGALHRSHISLLSPVLRSAPHRRACFLDPSSGRFCMDKDELGRRGEDIAAAHLRERGFEILDRNWRVREGELDIVAREGAALVVVEVKTRSSTRFGLPIEAITRVKAQRLRRLAYAWAREHDERSRHLRIDAVGIVAPDGVPSQVRHVRAVA